MSRNGIRDQIAIVGVGSTGFTRRSLDRSNSALAYEASVAAIRDAGLRAEDIDGVISSPGLGRVGLLAPSVREMVSGLRLPTVRYFSDGGGVMASPLVEAMNAIHAGSCDTVLVYHPNYRTPFHSRRAAEDPYRRTIPPSDGEPTESVRGAAAYAAWISNYRHHHPQLEERHLGMVALNSRRYAVDNPLAAIREPLTMDQYLASPMVRDPLRMLDMDLPVDGADAFVLTTVERARELVDVPVLVRAAVTGMVGYNDEDQLPSLGRHGHDVSVEQLWERSGMTRDEIDLAFLYDGFTFIAVSWLEKLGWAAPGDGGPYFEAHWQAEDQRLLLDGRIPVNTHGGSLSEGGTQGSGHLREAVRQLRGTEGDRQIRGARSAVLGIGGFFFNAGAAILVRDPEAATPSI